MDYSGQLHLSRGDGRARAIIDLSYAPSLAAVETLAGVCHGMTTAQIARCTFVEADDPGLAATSGEIYDLEYAANFKFRRDNPTNDFKYRQFRLPAPKIDILELIEGRGYRVKQSYGDAMAAALSTFYGETLHFVSGWLVH